MTEPLDLHQTPIAMGADGRCDHDHGCNAAATKAVLSACTPPCSCGSCGWDGAPAAAVAFLCDEHVDAEAVAQREHAEHNAGRMHGTARVVWDALLDNYPQPVDLARLDSLI